MTTNTTEPNAGSHTNHDRLLIAAHAARDLTGGERERAEALLAACDACRTLELELRAIATATRSVPPPAHLAGRDFRISADRAAALSRGRWWRRVLRPFGRPTGSAVRPLALTLTTLGFAGLILASLSSFPLGGTGAAPAAAPGSSESRAMLQASQTPAVSPVPEAAQPLGASDLSTDVPRAPGLGYEDGVTATDSGGTLAGAGQGGGQPTTPSPAPARSTPGTVLEGEPAGPTPLVLLSVGFLGAGLGLLLLRLAAQRLR
jgi:anti-sigma factor RsiW